MRHHTRYIARKPCASFARSAERERGNSVVEFALLAPLLIVMSLGLLTLALTMHTRTVITDAAAEGARVGAHSTSLPAARERTAVLIEGSLGAAYATDIDATWRATSAGRVVTVHVRAPIPLLGFSMTSPPVLEAHADALAE